MNQSETDLGIVNESQLLRFGIKRSLLSLQELMRRIWHYKISDQAGEINIVLRGHYAYYGVAGNLRSLVKVYRAVERYWRSMLCSRSWAGRSLTFLATCRMRFSACDTVPRYCARPVLC